MISSLVLFAQIGGVQFSVSASPDTVFVRQQVSYDAALRLDELSPPRFLEGPHYTPPSIKGVVEVYAFPFDTAGSILPVTVDGVKFKQYTYHSAIFPLTAGVDTILPSTLTYTRLNEADPYASQSSTVQSATRYIVVLPLPAQGKPADFSGAVGDFTIAMVADSQGLNSGSAFGVRARVLGTGDLSLLQRPELDIPGATVVSTTDSVAWDSTGTLMHGFKEFRWLVTPRSGGQLMIPQMRYSYFNPTTKTYVTAVAAAIPLTIVGDSLASSPEHDSLSITAFSKLVHTLRQQVLLLVGILVLGSVIGWGAVRRYRNSNR